MSGIFYELEGYLRKGLRCVLGIEDERLFVIEENPTAWSPKDKLSIFVCEGNAYRDQKHRSITDRDRVGSAGHVFEARRKIAEYCKNNPRDQKQTTACPVELLPGGDSSEFYPTPKALAGKMLAKVDWKRVKSILEPSAGKGDLVFAVQHMARARRYDRFCPLTGDVVDHPQRVFDVIEMDYNLRLMLRGLGLRLVGDDFLQYRTEKRYDLIMMNPPFSAGATHLLHAIELMQNGGQIVCLLNAETIRNPYTNERKLLQSLLADYAARIEFVQNAFTQAERKTGVEVAIVYLDIPSKRRESTIFDNAQKAVEVEMETDRIDQTSLVISDEVEALIQYYKVEAKAGVDLMTQYAALVPYIMDGKESYSKPLIELTVGDGRYQKVDNELVNQYLHDLRYKYWKIFLNRPELQRKLTSDMANEYHDKVREMADYEFNRHNIAQVLFDIQSQLVVGVEESIMKLFDTLSAKHCMDNAKNIHYYTGWKTNKAHAVGMKAILPINGFHSSYSWQKDKLDEYRIVGVLADLEKSLNYLDKGEVGISYDVAYAIQRANEVGKAEATLSYFTARFYKKGTCHITFHPEVKPIIDRLNIFAGRNKGWLPPCYGRKAYRDMDAEERAVIDEFQGEEAYTRVANDPGKYILDAGSLRPLLTE